MKPFLIFLLSALMIFLAGAAAVGAAPEIPLAGEWWFQLDPDGKGRNERWHETPLHDRIHLPGTIDAQRKAPASPKVEMKHLSRLEQAGMLDQAPDFVRASGALSVIFYREKNESALRAPGFGGFHLLDLQDFPGQGTALVGILDAFMDSKGLVTPEAWREFCSETVPLLLFDRFCGTSDMTFEADAQVAHHGRQPFSTMSAQWRLTDDNGDRIAGGDLAPVNVPTGGITDLGRISITPPHPHFNPP